MLEVNVLSPLLFELLAPDTDLEQIATGFRFTEGPLWDPRTDSLLFSDIPADRIYRWTDGQDVSVFCELSGKSNGLTWGIDGQLLACEHLNRQVVRRRDDGGVEPVVTHYRGKRLNSPNDLLMRSDGVLYFSDPPYGIQSAEMGAVAEQEQPLNGFYMLRPGATEPELARDDFERPNGLAFSPGERRLYVADTPRYQVRVFEVAEDGTLHGGEVFAQFSEVDGVGRPDGMAVDDAGNLYTTGPGGLWIVAPDGTKLGHIRFPEKTSNCTWGDADRLSLFVTASSSVYRLRTSIPGIVPPGRWKR